MCLDSGTENRAEQKRVRSNVVGHGRHAPEYSARGSAAGVYARRGIPRGTEETGSRSPDHHPLARPVFAACRGSPVGASSSGMQTERRRAS
ncbi:hypothetical protein DBV15_01163 [Temnothorax longispinosus]|uniref:Uncharacterized protein n=1 Tax=Temnothorax longispinosus TaxID=300112 RepID=A0A4V3S641_9HYME|nr:hypothetical protein DBV15_01163 [Temnothorax longispinosus]